MYIEHSSHEMTAERLNGDEPVVVGPPWLGSYQYRRGELERVLRCLFLARSSNTCGAMPLIICRGVGLKLKMAAATEGWT